MREALRESTRSCIELQSTGAPVAAIDAKGNVYAAYADLYAWGASCIDFYAPGSSTIARTITKGVEAPSALALDANLCVANRYSSAITVYAPGGSKPTRTIRTGVDYRLALSFNP